MAGSVVDILATLTDQTAAFLPNLVGAVILLIIGLVLGKIIGRVVKEFLLRIKLDYYVSETHKPMISLADIFSLLVRWWIYLGFVAAAVSVLSITALESWVIKILNFVPSIIGASLILVSGYVLAEYIRGHLKKTNSVYSLVVAKILFFFIIYVAIALALPVLGIPSTLIGNILLIIIASIGVGVAIALGLGMKDAVAEISKRYVKKMKL